MNTTLVDGDKLLVKSAPAGVGRQRVVLFRQADGVFVKRCVGLPGDVVHIRGGEVWVNGHRTPDPASIVRPRMVPEPTAGPLPTFNIGIVQQYDTLWTMTDFGPYLVPRKGMRLPLRTGALKVYGALIERENTPGFVAGLRRTGTASYTFQHYYYYYYYYYVLGDNRPASTDSRILGPIARENLIGEARLILFSYHHLFELSRLGRII